MPNQKNKDQVQAIKEKMGKAKNVILADYQGMDVATQVDLRAKVVEAGGEFTVSKNTLLKLVLAERMETLPAEMQEALNGPTAILYGYEDAVTSTKALVDFAKEMDALKIKAGLLLGSEDQADQVLSVTQIEDLAKLPSREELIAQLLSRLNSPRAGFVNVLAGNLRGLANVLNAIKDQKAATN